MRKDFGAKEWLYPMPVLIIASYSKDGKTDAMNAAWGGISDNKEIGLCLSKEHKTVENILFRKAFTVSPGIAPLVRECDYFGVVSANDDPNKFEKAKLHDIKSFLVDAPLIQEFPLTLECRLISYDEKTSHLFGEIVNVSIDESILDKEGNVDITKLKPITYDPIKHEYLLLGERAGKAFSIGKELI